MLVQWNFCSLFQDLQKFAREEWHFVSLVSTLTVNPTVPQQKLLWRCQVCYQGLRRGRKRC